MAPTIPHQDHGLRRVEGDMIENPELPGYHGLKSSGGLRDHI